MIRATGLGLRATGLGLLATGLGLLALGAAVGCARAPAKVAGVEAEPARPPPLVVLIVVDQLPTRLLERTSPAFTGGLHRLTGPRAFRATARYHHAATNTCPGHATISTGADPSVHGIVTNLWFTDGEPVYCSQLELLKAQPLADRVVEAGGRVVSVSHKDRGAMLLAGARGRAVWYDPSVGTFTGAEWAGLDLTALRATPWQPTAPELYGEHAADDQPFEGGPDGTTFPHDVDDPRAFLYSGQAGAALVDLALAAVEAEALGADATPDLLTVSFSNTDYVGHAYTVESWEAMDALVVVDRELGRLFHALDARLGADRWAAVLTSDHGVAPADAARLSPRAVLDAANAALEGIGLEGPTRFGEPFLTLPHTIPADRRDEAARAVAAAAAGVPGVAAAHAWRQDGIPDDTPYAEAVRASLHPDHAGDVYLLLDEGTMFGHGRAPTGAGHGTPYAYDAQVPLLLTGAGVRAGTASELVDVRRVAPTVAALLGVSPPGQASLPAVGAALTSRDERPPSPR